MVANQILVRVISLVIIGVILYIGYLIFFNIKKKEFKKRGTVELCPNCGSANKQIHGLWTAPFGPAKYRCSDCGYEGIFVEVDRDKVNYFKSTLKKK